MLDRRRTRNRSHRDLGFRRGGISLRNDRRLGGCSSLQATPPAAVTLRDADSGGTTTLVPGQRLVLRLNANATTGFAWQTATAPAPAILSTVSSTYEPPAGGGIGAGGTQVLIYQAALAGQTTLRLIYVQPFNPGNVAREFTCTVRVD